MPRVILRSSSDVPAAFEEAQRVIESLKGSIVNHSGRTMLVDMADAGCIDELRRRMPGWAVSEQGPKVQIPDTRLKVR